MKHCTNCGLQLPQEVTTCPRCGSFIPYHSPASAESNSSAETLPAPYAETTQRNYGPIQESAPTLPTQSPYQPAPASGAGTPPPPPLQKEGTNYAPQAYTNTPPAYQPQQAFPPRSPNPYPQYGPPSQPPVYIPQPSPYGPPSQPYGPVPQQPSFPAAARSQSRGLSRGMTILLVVLALLIMFGGFSLIYYTTVARPAQLRAQATAAVQTILTNDAHSTAVANAQATGTAVAYANATSTAQTQATAQAQATATALQGVYTQATSGTSALNSSLSAQDANNWDEYETTDGGGCHFSGGALHASLFTQHFYVPCFAQGTNFSNFAFQVQMTINKGDQGGLVFRADEPNAKFYLFRVGLDGNYGLYVSKDRNHNMSLAFDSSSAINTTPGQPNLLTVIAQGSNIYLYINKNYVASANDGSYSSGSIGVFASDTTSNTDVSFSNARVWNL